MRYYYDRPRLHQFCRNPWWYDPFFTIHNDVLTEPTEDKQKKIEKKASETQVAVPKETAAFMLREITKNNTKEIVYSDKNTWTKPMAKLYDELMEACTKQAEKGKNTLEYKFTFSPSVESDEEVLKLINYLSKKEYLGIYYFDVTTEEKNEKREIKGTLRIMW